MGIQNKFRRGATWSELPGNNSTWFNFCEPFSAWKRGVKLWHKSSYRSVRQIGKGCHVILYSVGDETQFNFWGLFLAWKRGWRIIMYLYIRLSRKRYVKRWHGHAKQIEKGCNVIRYSVRGDGNTISEDLFQHGNEAICTFTCVSPANLKSNFVLYSKHKWF